MPSLRSLLRVREMYPSTSVLLTAIGSSLGLKLPEPTKKSKKSKDNAIMDNSQLISFDGMSANKIEKEVFDKEMNIINRPADY